MSSLMAMWCALSVREVTGKPYRDCSMGGRFAGSPIQIVTSIHYLCVSPTAADEKQVEDLPGVCCVKATMDDLPNGRSYQMGDLQLTVTIETKAQRERYWRWL